MKLLIFTILSFFFNPAKEPVASIPAGTIVILQDYSGYNFYPQQWESSFQSVVGLRVKSTGTDVIQDVFTGELFYRMSFTDRFGNVLPVVYWPANKVNIVFN